MSAVKKYLQLLRRNSAPLCSILRTSRHSSTLIVAARTSEVYKQGKFRQIRNQQLLRVCLSSSINSSVVSKSPSATRPKAVIFDLGGVVVPSPQFIFDRFEEKWNLTAGSLVKTIKATGNGGSFARMEMGQYSVEEFCEPFRHEYQSFTGHKLTIDQVQEFAYELSNFTKLTPHQEVVEMFRRLKERGIKVAILTNNFRRKDGHTTFPKEELEDVDVVVQSCVEGLRKPEQAIFDVTLERLGVRPEEAVFLDDLGGNLKTARLMGMSTIKVTDISDALESLEQLLDVSDHTHEVHVPGTSAVSPKLQLPMENLVHYLKERHGLEQEAGPVIRQFRHGQSNPTYYLAYGGQEMVLRKKPPGKLLPSAHAVEREYRVMEATARHSVPIPALMSLCEDNSVIGTPFYLMKYIPGRVFKDPALFELAADERAGFFRAMCHTLAAIHSVDIQDAKLENFGRQGHYVSRQVARWSKQYEASKTHDIPAMDHLTRWLPLSLPQSECTTVVHGDFRMDNLIFSVGSPEVKAVLDWELSTLGDPISDLAYCCMIYHLPQDQPHLSGLFGLNLAEHGIPSEEEFVADYCRLTNTADISSHWNFYMAFTFFRVAAILQGVYKRSLQNQASAENASSVGLMAGSFAKKGWEFAMKQDQRTMTISTPHKSTMDSPKTQQSYTTLAPHLCPVSGGRSLSSSAAAVDGTPIALMTRDLANFPPRLKELRTRLLDFMEEVVYPAERTLMDHQTSHDRWIPHPLIEKMKSRAKSEGLWNLFLPLETDPEAKFGAGLTNMEYSHLAEIMGTSIFASEVFNCSPPDTGNMEVLLKYGSSAQQAAWLVPLLAGEIRSCFAMTEPEVASCDATNIKSSIKQSGDSYILNGRKWWISGAMDPRCKICIFMGKTDPSASKYQQQSMILVPMDTPGVKVLRPLTVFGLEDAPGGHADIEFTDVQVPRDNILLGVGRGFEIAQGRLGPGRIHHCMRLIGMAERSLEMMACRVQERTAFGGALANQGSILHDLAWSRLQLEQARLLTLKAAHLMDTVGNKHARREIAMIKVATPHMAQQVIDRAIQAHGALGLSSDRPLAQFFSLARILRLADGPDEVHLSSLGKMELKAGLSNRVYIM